MNALYFEDFEVGRRFTTLGLTLTEAEIIHFALTYDPQPFHTDVEAAQRSPYGGLIASGFQTIALVFRLFAQTGALAAASIGGSGMDEIRWYVPVRPGDTLHAEVEVIERRPSASRNDRGYVRFRYAGVNQHGERVLSFLANQLLLKRGAVVGD